MFGPEPFVLAAIRLHGLIHEYAIVVDVQPTQQERQLTPKHANETIAANPKLNEARARRNKPPMPPYRQVDSASYVTAVTQRIEHVKKPATGTHASLIMHVRQGHWRHYQTGEKSFIRLPL